MVEYKDNFLPKEAHQKLYELLVTGDNTFPWYYTPHITRMNDKEDKGLSYFIHLFYHIDRPLSRQYDEFIRPFWISLNAKAFIRIKANLYPGQDKLTQHASHQDFDYKHKAAIYCINTCDGYTAFKDGKGWKKVNSVANRLITFDGSMEHASTDCTNEKIRVNINFNYM